VKTKKELVSLNTAFCCAERRLIDVLMKEAFRHGVRPHEFASWTHRKYNTIKIERQTSIGLGTCFPCVFCRRSLERLDMRVVCMVEGDVRRVRLSDCEIESKLTTGQKLKTQPVKPCVVKSLVFTRRPERQTKL